MIVDAIEMYHRNNPPISPISNYIPYYNGQPINIDFKYLYNNDQICPIVGGAGISVDFVSPDGDDIGYIFISNTITNASSSTGGSGFNLIDSNGNVKQLRSGANIAVADFGPYLTISAPGVATSQSLTSKFPRSNIN